MVSSTQITNKLNQQPDPMTAMFKIWQKTRYLVAQEPASDDYTETVPSYYKGRFVIPGPKADPKVSDKLGFPHLTVNDFQTMMNRYHIRFIDNRTTENADESVRRSLYTVMDDSEADDYEKTLRKYYDDRRKTVPSQATE